MQFYRVYHSGSISQYDDDDGFLAGDPNRDLDFNPRTQREKTELTQLLEQHLDWYNRDRTPFISMYKKLQTAIETAKAWERRGKRNVRIAGIDRDALENYGYVRYRNVRRLAGKLGLWIDREIWQSTENELIVFRQIPAGAVRTISTVRDFEQEEDDDSDDSEGY